MRLNKKHTLKWDRSPRIRTFVESHRTTLITVGRALESYLSECEVRGQMRFQWRVSRRSEIFFFFRRRFERVSLIGPAQGAGIAVSPHERRSVILPLGRGI